jgi:hypothetical protein
MSILLRRAEQLESWLVDSTGLRPFSAERFAHWEEKLDQLGRSETPDFRGMSLDVLDTIRQGRTGILTAVGSRIAQIERFPGIHA